MIMTSSAFNSALEGGNRNYQVLASIELLSGETLTLDNTLIWSSGLSLDDSIATTSEALEIGTAIVNKATLVINNMTERFSAYDFSGAVVTLQVGLKPSATDPVAYINKGTFTVESASYNTTLITLTCIDNMHKFDAVYNSSLTFPSTALAVVQDACTACGVTLGVQTFTGATTAVIAPPEQAVTYRNMLSWIGQLVGCCWRINNAGELMPVWYGLSVLGQAYDGGTFAYNSGAELDGGTFAYGDGDTADGGAFDWSGYFTVIHAASADVAVDDTLVTGVKIQVANTAEDAAEAYTEYTAGTDGYSLVITDNPLITADNAQTIANTLAGRLAGMKYRKGNVVHVSDPRMEAGDVMVYADHKGHAYPMLVSQVLFTAGEYQTSISASEPPLRNVGQRYSQSMQTGVSTFQAIARERNSRESAIADLEDDLANAPGLYQSTESDGQGGTIYYLHDKPTRAASNIIWKMSSSAVGVSTNGGQSWNAGLTADGTAIVQRLYANAVTAGILKSSDYQYSSGNFSTAGMIVDLNSQVIRAKKFAVDSSGKLYATGADVSGAITASSGKIGNWNIGATSTTGELNGSLYYGTFGYSGSIYLIPAGTTTSKAIAGRTGTDWVITAGENWGVTKTGSMHASAGTIGPWTITTTSIQWGKTSSQDYSTFGVFLGTQGLLIGGGTSGNNTEINSRSISVTGYSNDGLIYATNLSSGQGQAVISPLGIHVASINQSGSVASLSRYYQGDYGLLTLLQYTTSSNDPVRGIWLNAGDPSAIFKVASDTAILRTNNGSTTYNLIRNHNNGNISVSASSGGLYLGYENTTSVNFLGSKVTIDSNGNVTTQGTTIWFANSLATTSMIRFLPGSDAYGHGISIGGGGTTIIGGGEAATAVEPNVSASGEAMIICGDGNIDFYSNCQDGYASRKTMTFNSAGYLSVPAWVVDDSGYITKILTYTMGTNPSAGLSRSYIVTDSTGYAVHALAEFIGGVETSGTQYALLRVYNASTSSHTSAQLGLFYPKNGTPYASLGCKFDASGTIFSNVPSGEAQVGAQNSASGNRIYLYAGSWGTVGIYSYDANGTARAIIARANNSSDITAYGAWTFNNGVVGNNSASGTPIVSHSTNGIRVAHFTAFNSTVLQVGGQWGSTSAYATKNITVSSSDIRLKENIADCAVTALPLINAIHMREFDWKREGRHQKIGFIADELEKLDENLAIGGGTNDDGTMNIKSVDTFYLLGYAIKAIQELSAEVKKLKGVA